MAMKARYTVMDGEIVSQTRNGVKHNYLPDPTGNVVALYDSNQARTDTVGYWPYGEEKNRTGATPLPFRFIGAQGYYRDAQDLSYVRARTYRQNLGRWMTPDPLSLYIDDTQRYAYANCRPTVFTDPSGEIVAVAIGLYAAACITAAVSSTWICKGNDLCEHCMASCVLTQCLGSLIAEALGGIKEIGTYDPHDDCANQRGRHIGGTTNGVTGCMTGCFSIYPPGPKRQVRPPNMLPPGTPPCRPRPKPMPNPWWEHRILCPPGVGPK